MARLSITPAKYGRVLCLSQLVLSNKRTGSRTLVSDATICELARRMRGGKESPRWLANRGSNADTREKTPKRVPVRKLSFV